MSDDVKTKCTCGGCGTETRCRYDTTNVTGLGGVYVYAAPPVDEVPHETGTTIKWPYEFDPKQTLLEELVQDLLSRVKTLETTVDQMQEDVLEAQGSLDALRDIMEAEADRAQPIDPLTELTLTVLNEARKLLEKNHK